MNEIFWTSHAKFKMQYYRLSESRIKRVIRNPERIEEGIAENTVAMMQPAGTKNNPYEIWVMITRSSANVIAPARPLAGAPPWREKQSKKGNVIKVISAWRYPGRTKVGEPLPKEILAELRSAVR